MKETETPLYMPVLFLTFNRLETTKQVFAEIQQARPPRLYLVSDGARVNQIGEVEKVTAVREYLLTNINWKCELIVLFRDTNLGCKESVADAITWFFEHEEMGIILEDDCVPAQSFFRFCQFCLNLYKNDTRVGMITGTSYLNDEVDSSDDYFFSKYTSIWGWATWRRAWKHYDKDILDWPKVKKEKLLNAVFPWDASMSQYFTQYYDRIYRGEIDTWDAQWGYVCRIESMLSVMPYKNLISNIGYVGSRSFAGNPFMNSKRHTLINEECPKGPRHVLHNLDVDKKVYFNVFRRHQKYVLAKWFLKKIKLYATAEKLYRKFEGVTIYGRKN